MISFKLFYYYTYFVIGLALLGLGTGSAVVALSRRLRGIDTTRLIMWLAPAAGAVGLVGYAVVARLATHTHLIWEGSTGVAVRQIVRLLAMSLSLTAVFFVIGVLLAKLIVAEAHDVRRLYFWDLTGAALACLLAVPLQATIGPPAMIVGSTGVLAVLGVVAASASGDRRTRRTGVAWTAVGAAAVVIGAVLAGGLEVRADETKTLRGGADVEAGDWGAVFRVDATRASGTTTRCTTTACGDRRSGATTGLRRRRTASRRTTARSRSPRQPARAHTCSSSGRRAATRSKRR